MLLYCWQGHLPTELGNIIIVQRNNCKQTFTSLHVTYYNFIFSSLRLLLHSPGGWGCPATWAPSSCWPWGCPTWGIGGFCTFVVGVLRMFNLHVGQVCWRWNHDRRHDVWKMWLHGSFFDAVITNKQHNDLVTGQNNFIKQCSQKNIISYTHM